MRLLLTGGGTGGHIYPALAVAREIERLDPAVEILYVGTAAGLEAGIVPAEGLAFETIPARGMVGGGLRAAPGAAMVAFRGFLAARRIIRRFEPDGIFGTGGYVTGPVALAARLGRVPLIIHEQNAFPGVANRLAARWASAVTVPYADARKHFPPRARVVVTGNPVRRSVLETTPEEGRRVLGLPERGLLLYLVGGSRGAGRLNQAIVDAIPHWLDFSGLHVLFACGRRYFDDTASALLSRGIDPERNDKITLVAYLDRADAAFAAADVIVTRAGGMTLAEVTARGVPAVIVPSPNVTHNHQEYNARVLARAGAARMILEDGLDGGSLERAVSELLSDAGRRETMRRASLGVGRPEAAADIARLVLKAARHGGARKEPVHALL